MLAEKNQLKLPISVLPALPCISFSVCHIIICMTRYIFKFAF